MGGWQQPGSHRQEGGQDWEGAEDLLRGSWWEFAAIHLSVSNPLHLHTVTIGTEHRSRPSSYSLSDQVRHRHLCHQGDRLDPKTREERNRQIEGMNGTK